jgi:hypothetical protein
MIRDGPLPGGVIVIEYWPAHRPANPYRPVLSVTVLKDPPPLLTSTTVLAGVRFCRHVRDLAPESRIAGAVSGGGCLGCRVGYRDSAPRGEPVLGLDEKGLQAAALAAAIVRTRMYSTRCISNLPRLGIDPASELPDGAIITDGPAWNSWKVGMGRRNVCTLVAYFSVLGYNIRQLDVAFDIVRRCPTDFLSRGHSRDG